MQVVQRFTEGPEGCMYLPGQQSTLTYEIVARLTPQEYEDRMNQGWRKFGMFLFRPVCATCQECRPAARSRRPLCAGSEPATGFETK